MGSQTPRLIAAAATITLLAAACSDEPTDHTDPPPTTTTTVIEKSESPTPTASPSPTSGTARPAAIDMATIDPCKLITDAKAASLGFDREPKPNDKPQFPPSKGCTVMGSSNGLIFGFEAVTTEGVDSYLSSAVGTVTESTVAGYRAAEIRIQKGASCYRVVDVNDGQMLYAQTTVLDPTKPSAPGKDEVCALTAKLTEAAVEAVKGAS